MKKSRYLAMDLRRGFLSAPFWLAVFGITFSWMVSVKTGNIQEESVLNLMEHVLYGGTSILIIQYVFTVLPYGTGICEDLENHYIRYLAVRGHLMRYVLSKVAVIFWTAVCVMVFGSMLFFLGAKIRLPWATEQYVIDNIGYTCFSPLLEQKHYFLWLLLYTLQKGFWYGVLSVFAAYLSLFMNNKLFIWSIPILLNQLLIETNVFGLGNIPYLNLPRVFDGKYVTWGSNGTHFLWSVAVSLILLCLCAGAIFHKLRKSL